MKNAKLVLIRWGILLTAICVAAAIMFYRIRPVIASNCIAKAKNVITNAANDAVINVLNENNIKYSDIAVISRNADGYITGVEIDTKKVNLLKSLISKEIYNIIAKDYYYDVLIPLGDFLFDDYTNGYGPRIKFRMQFSHTENLDFESGFVNAGINNVLHQIIVTLKINGSVLAVGMSKPFSLKTSVIAAETVIAGTVPDSYTNVEEKEGSDVADKIFNYADVK